MSTTIEADEQVDSPSESIAEHFDLDLSDDSPLWDHLERRRQIAIESNARLEAEYGVTMPIAPPMSRGCMRKVLQEPLHESSNFGEC